MTILESAATSFAERGRTRTPTRTLHSRVDNEDILTSIPFLFLLPFLFFKQPTKTNGRIPTDQYLGFPRAPHWHQKLPSSVNPHRSLLTVIPLAISRSPARPSVKQTVCCTPIKQTAKNARAAIANLDYNRIAIEAIAIAMPGPLSFLGNGVAIAD